jgi:DNA repair protein RecO (recombination protein O)
MAIAKTEGVVIKYQKFRDTSLIVTFYTRDLGRLKTVAKGARGQKSKFRSSLDLFSYGQLVVYVKQDRDLQLLSDFESLRSFRKVQEDLRRFAHAGAAGEHLEAIVAGEEPHPELFEMTIGFLESLESAPPASQPALFRAFQLQTSTMLGYRPELGSCVGCGRTDGNMKFSPRMGGIVCPNCAAESFGAAALPERVLNLFRSIGAMPLDEIAAGLEGHERAEKEVGPLLDAFLQYHVDRYRGLKSLQFLRKLHA